MLFRAAVPYTARRYVSNIAPKYHDKVYAFPFVTPAKAAVTLVSSIRTLTKPFGRPTLLRGIRSLLALFVSERFQLSQPTSVRAVYYPAWLINGVVRTNVSIPGSDYSQNVTTYLPSKRPSYYPGTSDSWISNVVFGSNGPNRIIPFPLDDLFLIPGVGEIEWLPFTRSPFHIPNAVSTVGGVAGKYTLKTEVDFFAAYPVLIPLYVVRYEHETRKDLYLECVYDASTTSGPHIEITYRHVDPDNPINHGHYHRRVFGDGGTPITIDNQPDVSLPQDLLPAVGDILKTSLRHETAALASSNQSVDASFMDDLRARPISESGLVHTSMSEYFWAERTRRNIVKLSKTLPGQQMTFQDSSGSSRSSDQVARFLKLGATPDAGRSIWLEHAAPQWWTQWLTTQTPTALAREKRRQEERLRREKRKALFASNQGPKVDLLPLQPKELNTKRKQDIKFEQFKERREKRLLEQERVEKEEASRAVAVKAQARAAIPPEMELQPGPERSTIAEVDSQLEESPMSKLRSLAAEFRSRLSS